MNATCTFGATFIHSNPQSSFICCTNCPLTPLGAFNFCFSSMRKTFFFLNDSHYWPEMSHLLASEACKRWHLNLQGCLAAPGAHWVMGRGLLSVGRRHLRSRGGRQNTASRRRKPQDLELAAQRTVRGAPSWRTLGRSPDKKVCLLPQIPATELFMRRNYILYLIWFTGECGRENSSLKLGECWPSRGPALIARSHCPLIAWDSSFFSLSQNRQIIQSDSQLACDIWHISPSDSALQRCTKFCWRH